MNQIPYTIDELSACSPHAIRSLVQEMLLLPKEEQLFRWHSFADSAATLAKRAKDSDPAAALEWSSISAEVYDRLARDNEGMTRHLFELSCMTLRSIMILALGPRPGHLVLDPWIVEEWFFRAAGLDLQRASALAHDLTSIEQGDAIALTFIAEKFEVLRPLLIANVLDRTDDLASWNKLLTSMLEGESRRACPR
jgi:hypothetical protein